MSADFQEIKNQLWTVYLTLVSIAVGLALENLIAHMKSVDKPPCPDAWHGSDVDSGRHHGHGAAGLLGRELQAGAVAAVEHRRFRRRKLLFFSDRHERHHRDDLE